MVESPPVAECHLNTTTYSVAQFIAYLCNFSLDFGQCLENPTIVGPKFEWLLNYVHLIMGYSVDSGI